MDVNLVQFRAFLTVARFRSFTHAAELLHISQPALTVQIQQLEESLGLKLLDRDTRHVVLTPSGRDLLPMTQRLLSEFDTIVGSARGLATKELGIVRLGCVPSIATTYLPDAIARFREKHPNVSFDVRDAISSRIVAMIRSDEIEIGITNGEPESPDLDAIDFYRDEIHAVFPKSHPLAALQKLNLDDVAKYPLVFLNMGLNSRTVLDDVFAAEGRFVKPVCEVTYTATAIGMVRAGLGVALLGSLIIRANNLQAFPELQSRPIANAALVRCIRLIRKKGRSLSPSAMEFKNLLMELRRTNDWAGKHNGSEVND